MSNENFDQNKIDSSKTSPNLNENSCLQSNRYILDILVTKDLKEINIQEELANILKSEKFQDKLRNLLSYYKPRGNEDVNTLQNKKLLGKIPVSQFLQHLIVKISDNFNLNLDCAFEQVEIYFGSNPQQLDDFMKKEYLSSEIQGKSEYFQQFSHEMLNDWKRRFELSLINVENEIMQNYFNERTNLIRILNFLIIINFNDVAKSSKVINDMVEVIIKNNKSKNYSEILWTQFVKYTADFKIIKNLTQELKECHSTQILKEQVEILDALNLTKKIFEEDNFINKNFLTILTTFAKQNFTGYLYEISHQFYNPEQRNLHIELAQLILDQSIMLIINLLDVWYYFEFENFTLVANKSAELSLTTLPATIFKDKSLLDQILNVLDELIKDLNTHPIHMTFYSIAKLLLNNTQLKDMTIKENISNILKSDGKLCVMEAKFNVMNSLSFLSEIYNRPILNAERHYIEFVYNNLLYFMISLNIKHYFNNELSRDLVYLVIKIISASVNNANFWFYDFNSESPIGTLFENLLNFYPLHFDLITKMCNEIKNNQMEDNVKVNSLFYRLLTLNYFNCRVNEYDITREMGNNNIVKLDKEIDTQWGVVLPKETKGEVIEEGTNVQVRFHYKFSMFQALFPKWKKVLHTFVNFEMGFIKLNEICDDHELYNNVSFINLFCSLISDNISNIKDFFSSGQIHTEVGLTKSYKELISYCFETVHLLSKNRNLYSFFNFLSKSIYLMIDSILADSSEKYIFINVLRKHFVGIFESRIRNNQIGYKYNSDINLIDVFRNTLILDRQIFNSGNTVIVLKVIKNFMKFPHILEFLKDTNSLEFLSNIWNIIIVNMVKQLSNVDHFTQIEEFNVCKEIVKIISNMFSLITVNPNKSNIISANQSHYLFYQFIVNCLNSIETSEIIIKLLKVKVIIDESDPHRPKTSLKNILWHHLQLELNFSNYCKNAAKRLLLSAFKCLNKIFDMVLIYKTTSDKFIKDVYYNIETIRHWDEEIFVIKNMPTYTTKSNINEEYSVNLFLTLMSYTGFEFYESLNYDNIDSYFSLKYKNRKNIASRVEEYLEAKDITESDLNVSTICLSTLNRILLLLKLQTTIEQQGEGDSKTNLNLSKSPNILNYLTLKKESGSYSESSLDLSNKYREFLCNTLVRQVNLSQKIEIMKFFALCAKTQIGFTSKLLEDLNLRVIKRKKFWEVLGILLKEDEDSHMMQDSSFEAEYNELLGFISLFVSNVFWNDVMFKNSIYDLLDNFKDIFGLFIKKSFRYYKPSDTNFLNNFRSKKMDRYEIFENSKERQFIEKGFRDICFDATIMKSLTTIFTKLIILNDFNENKQNKSFAYYNELIEFINKYIMEFVQNYNVRLDTGFIRDFNLCLSNLENFTGNEEDYDKPNDSFSPYTRGTSYKMQVDHTEDVIYIQNFERIISNNSEDYAFPFLIDNNSVFNYSANYFIDLKELYTIMNTKNYSRELFEKYLDQFVAYNLELSLFDAKTQTMHSIQYLIGFTNSIGIGNAFMSTKIFTGKETFDLINSNNYNKKFAESLINVNKDPKFNFNLISDVPNQGMSIVDFGKFVENSLNKYLKIDIFNFTTGDFNLPRDESNSVIFNYYSQFIFLKYAITTYIVDKLIYLYNNYEASKLNSAELGSTKCGKYIMRLLSTIDESLLIFINEYEKVDIDKLHLSVITLIFACLNYLLQSNYKFTNIDLTTVNNIIKKLIVMFDILPSYQIVIIYILNAYANINYFVDAEDENGLEVNKTIDLNLLLNYDNFKIIKKLMKLLNSQSPETCYLSIVNLFSTLIRNYAITLDIFNTEKVLLAFSINDRFDNTIDIREYQANDRNNNHILWCWTLIFYRNVLAKLYFIGKQRNYDVMKYSSLYDCVIDFIIKNESRFYKVLSDTDYHDKGGNSIHKSLAYLDELELMTYIINLLFMVSSKWKLKSKIYFDFYNRFASNILSNTFKLFITNIKLSNHYKCYSSIETNMNEIFPLEKDVYSNLSKDERYTSIQSPVKKRKDFTLMKPILIQSTPKRNVSNYSPSLFYSRVDIQLNKILYNITNIIKNAVSDPTSDPNSFLNYLKNIYSKNAKNYGVEVKIKNFEDQCQNILYALYFAIHSLESYVKNHETIKILYSLNIIFFNNTRSSVEFGNLNLEYTRDDFNEIYNTNNNAIIAILLACSHLNELIVYLSTDSSLREVTLRKLEDIQKSFKDRDNLIGNFEEIKPLMEKMFSFVRAKLE